MVMWVICLFTFLCFGGFFGSSSSPEESESVASWSVRITRSSFLRGGLVFAAVLHGGSPSKFELEACGLKGWWRFRGGCTDMKVWCVSLILLKKRVRKWKKVVVVVLIA